MKKLFSLLTLALLTLSAMAATTVTFDFTTGYTNGQVVTSAEQDGVTLTFDKGTNSNAPAWYTTGAALRIYGGGTMTVAAEATITNITFTFGSGDNTNAITANVGTYAEPTWTGSANNVVFTVGGTSKHRRFAKVEVTLDNDAPVVETLKAPVFTPGDGTTFNVESLAVNVSCETENASIYVYEVVDGEIDYTTQQYFFQNGEFYVNATKTYAAMSTKGDEYSDFVYATYTKIEEYEGGTDISFVALTDTIEGGTTAGWHTIVKDGVTMKFYGTVSNYTLTDSLGNVTNEYHQYRIYKNNPVQFTSGKTVGSIRKIQFFCDETNPTSGFADAAGLDKETGLWEGETRDITFTASNKQVRANSIIVTVDDNVPAIIVADPVLDPENNTKFIGSQKVTITCATEGATIYYTTDSVYQVYEAPITITETSTVKAYAELNGAQSNTVSAKYIKLAEVSTIAEANALDNKQDFIFYGNVVVVYQNGSNLWVKDNTGYGLIYGNQVPQVEVGATLSEEWEAQYYLFRGMIHEYQYPTNVTASDEPLQTITATEYAEADLTTEKINERVLVKGLTLTAGEDAKYLYTADGMAIYNQFGIEYPTVEEGKTYDVEGMVSYYNNAVQIMPIAITEAAATTVLRGDVDNSNTVTIDDVTALIDYLLSGDASKVNLQAADCDNSTTVTIDDVTTLIDYLLSGAWKN
ncbi:MAG: chitobiase/beta-hexosaminidase C-terminal domain-containing protein [Muribaculaceae bacterium]|nr:chitobiase/beta-hexosaminidase C-terminal domain-containing protein [Muribaculaceae bacterium]